MAELIPSRPFRRPVRLVACRRTAGSWARAEEGRMVTSDQGAAQRHDQLSDAVLESFEFFRGRPRTIELLPGGITNSNFKITTPDGRYVVRLSHDDPGGLPIDRDQEHRNSVRAAAAGVGAPVISYAPQHHILVVGFLDGITYSNDNFTAEGVVPRVAAAIRRLHAAEPFDNEFNMFAVQRNYLSIVQRNGYRLPAGYLEFAGHFERMAAAFAADPSPLVPCNNDLLAANFIDNGEEIRLIDYEYSGNNDPCFEIGNIWSECGLTGEQLAELVTEYYGRPLAHKIARAELQGILAKYGWTLWGSIQAATSTLDFDFWSWGMERYEAAAALLSSRRFEQLLDHVGHPRQGAQ
jgi:thiamine kinase-like enzyme